MWQAVRRELARLEWGVEPPLTLDLMADWTQTVSSLVTIRQAIGPISTADPIALLATATTGAARTAEVKPILAPSLGAVSAALADVGQDMASYPDLDRKRDAATLNHVAYELVHWVRVRTPDEQAKAWLLAGETALDGAIHAPTTRSAVGVGLAAWQGALAAVQPVQAAPIVRRSVALGHLALLRDTHALVEEAKRAGALPELYADALLGSIRELARAHQTTLSQIDCRRLGSTRGDQAVMLKLGTAVRILSGRPDHAEPSHVRLDALLRSSAGQAVLVANLTSEPSAQPAAARISRLSLEYLTNPRMLREVDLPKAPAPPAPVEPKAAAAREPRAAARIALMESTVSPGTVLDGPSILALCQARDLGVAAATGDPLNPPEILRGVDSSRWPQLVAEGRQAVTDLVGSVIPMVYAQTRRTPNAADTRGQMFVELMGAAHRFDPQRTSPEGWASYAWMTLKHARMRGVDEAGVVRKRTTGPRPSTVTLDGRDPASRTPGPGEVVEDRHAVAAITQALGQLPTSLREPLSASMQGHPLREIAEDLGYSESTAHRRIKEARELLKGELDARRHDSPWVPFDTGTDPVLRRAQRLFEQTPTLSRGPGIEGGMRR
ncbi:RNA polymerase sigma factor, sigma-70 family [Tessaracoccus bendigoensis DSM 12906]|uniref:RNA polymerase sigma factor, sigma-70 family n=1 Tax=Tessaracoccus bendigoensis DSM 12906 TaxID=1123357 RepID=A0A1M6LLR3_9ACTN|nr:sigma-70 family RNA polymerase sigma factor [Tessaracoccus bendigoensis]SHJ72201.1 RNA polymerase sigma factor, sigma-70 family [Tessaracoccus bendigoensis DSM 12906]